LPQRTDAALDVSGGSFGCGDVSHVRPLDADCGRERFEIQTFLNREDGDDQFTSIEPSYERLEYLLGRNPKRRSGFESIGLNLWIMALFADRERDSGFFECLNGGSHVKPV
jgi:hypothetical protein